MEKSELLKVAKPILFNTDMVRSILDGRKTVTRRVIKHDVYAILNSTYHKEHPEVDDKQIISELCMPSYQPGDILYVRETWAQAAAHTLFYRADKTIQNILWRPSIHMPKEAARIFLKVTNVRVERLQDIDDEQAKKEWANWRNGKNVGFEEKMSRSAVERFAEIWDSTIKKSDINRYGWNANPYVWKIEFERVKLDVREG